MSSTQVSAFAEEGNIPGDQIIMPMVLLLNQTINFNGQGFAGFDYSTNGGTEKVRLYFQNNDSKAVNVRLVDPNGFIWYQGQIAAGKSYTTTYNWTSSHSGKWTIELNNSDGSQGSVWISVHSDV